jgi:hypothetical protein
MLAYNKATNANESWLMGTLKTVLNNSMAKVETKIVLE